MNENLMMDETIQDEADVLGGSFILDTDMYDMVIEVAYKGVSEGGANSLSVILKDQQGRTHKETFWITSGTAKGCKNYYFMKDRKTGKPTEKKQYLPGFSKANHLCLLATGKSIAEIPTETKQLSLYNFKEKKEILTEVEVLTALSGTDVTVGIVRQTVNKTKKNDDGVYVSTGEVRDENIIDKAFRTKDHMTVSEITAEATESLFHDKWIEKNKGITRDRSTVSKSEATSETPEAGKTKSLF